MVIRLRSKSYCDVGKSLLKSRGDRIDYDFIPIESRILTHCGNVSSVSRKSMGWNFHC